MTATLLGPIPPGKGVVPYLSGPAAGRAVYDKVTGLSWTLNANLPAENTFGFHQKTTITSDVDGSSLTVNEINKDGAVLFAAVDPNNTASGWIVSMNNAHYAGTDTWVLPALDDLKNLEADTDLAAGDPRLEWPFFVGPFFRLQPGFYWGCVRAAKTGNNGPCDLSQDAPAPAGSTTPFEWSFNFDDGFQGTDLNNKQFYVMVYFPAP